MPSNTSTMRCVYVISYDSQMNKSQRLYLRTSPTRKGVADIQQARRFGSLGAAREELRKLKFGNPLIERHETLIAEEATNTFDLEKEITIANDTIDA